MSKKQIKWSTYLATAYIEGFAEGERATEDQQKQAWQYLIDTGMAWRLQGYYGRLAKSLIDAGICQAAK